MNRKWFVLRTVKRKLSKCVMSKLEVFIRAIGLISVQVFRVVVNLRPAIMLIFLYHYKFILKLNSNSKIRYLFWIWQNHLCMPRQYIVVKLESGKQINRKGICDSKLFNMQHLQPLISTSFMTSLSSSHFLHLQP